MTAESAVALFSTDLDEVQQLSDRLVVMSRGRIIAEVPPDTPRARLGLLMGGEAAGASSGAR